MSSPIARVVAELNAALAEIEEAQIALDNAQAKAALALRGFAEVTEGSNHDLAKVARASWAGAANRFDRARRVLEASAHAIATYQREIAPGLTGDSRSIPPHPAGGQLAEGGEKSNADRVFGILARNADEVAERAQQAAEQVISAKQSYRPPAPPPVATQSGTGSTSTAPLVWRAQADQPMHGEFVSGVVMAVLAGVVGLREMRRRRKERD